VRQYVYSTGCLPGITDGTLVGFSRKIPRIPLRTSDVPCDFHPYKTSRNTVGTSDVPADFSSYKTSQNPLRPMI